VDVCLAGVLRRDKKLQTSTRVLTAKPLRGPAKASLGLCRWLRLFGRNEEFDADSWKTKCVFIATQALYTLVVMLPAGLLATSQGAHFSLILMLLVLTVWNGAGYYFEVFSRRYEAELLRREEEVLRELATVAGQAVAAPLAAGQDSPERRFQYNTNRNSFSRLSDSLSVLADVAGGAIAATSSMENLPFSSMQLTSLLTSQPGQPLGAADWANGGPTISAALKAE